MINEFKSKTTTTICHNQSTEMVPFTVASPPRMLSRTGLAILCGGMDENDPIGSATSWSPVGGAVWDGGVDFLKEVYVTGGGL